MDTPLRRTRILLVDDDVRDARVLQRMLGDDGFEVELSTDGARAIARLSVEPLPDVLITDLRIPHADGMAVARYARARSSSIVIVFVTGYPELVSGRLDPPAVVYAKPFDYAALTSDLRTNFPL